MKKRHLMLSTQPPRNTTSLPLIPHPQNLHHSNKNVQKVQLQTDTLIHHILLDHPRVRQARMMQDLLRIVQREPPKHSQPTIQPQILRKRERPHRRNGQNERGEARDGNDGDAGEQGATEVEVFFLLGCRADEGDGAHHGDGVEAGAGQEGRLHEHDWGEDGGLAEVEASPEGVFLDVADGFDCQLDILTPKLR